MTTIENEFNKILKDQCPIKSIKKMYESNEQKNIKKDVLIDYIEVLKMHESEIRRLRQWLELNYQSDIVQRYLDKHTQTE